MKIPQLTDRRVVRTRAKLRDALLALILERGWDATSIQDVCERAQVGRSTFYTHFADKEELLLSGFDELRAALRAMISARPRRAAVFLFARPLLEHAAENRRMFRALVGKRSSQRVQQHFLQLVIELVTEELASHGQRRNLEVTVQYLAGAFARLVFWWVDMKKPLTAAELDDLFQTLTAAALGMR